MGDITRRMRLYHRAYFLASQGLPDRTKAVVPNISTRLDEAVWEQIRRGETDANKIAAVAVTKVFAPIAYTIYAPPMRKPRTSSASQILKRAG
jgi:hypothetical protein